MTREPKSKIHCGVLGLLLTRRRPKTEFREPIAELYSCGAASVHRRIAPRRNTDRWSSARRPQRAISIGSLKVSIGVLTLAAALCGAALGADKSGVGPNSISLPKGPGSIEGLG